MLVYLDNGENLKGHPNENFGREVMELFTLGEGNYTERDVQEAARDELRKAGLEVDYAAGKHNRTAIAGEPPQQGDQQAAL